MMATLRKTLQEWGQLITAILIIFGFAYIPWSIKTELAVLRTNQITMQDTLKYGKEQREILTREVRENLKVDIERLRSADMRHEDWQMNVIGLLNKTSAGMDKLQALLEDHVIKTR